jgi:hypothetical protein
MGKRVTFPLFANQIYFDGGILEDAVCDFSDQSAFVDGRRFAPARRPGCMCHRLLDQAWLE